MRIKKMFLLLLILLLSISFSLVSFTEQDVTPPTLNAINVDKTSVTVDETFTLTVNITDDVSGVAYANSAYMSPSREQVKYAVLAPISGDNYQSVYTAELYDEVGVWEVYYVTATDYAGNTATYYYDDSFDLSPADIEILGTTPENTPPNINMINVDKTSVTVDETFTLIVNITDDISGVAYANSAYMSPSQEQVKYAILALVSGDIYQSVYTVDQYDEIGVWEVYYVTATDYAGNTVTYYYDDTFDLSPADIEIYGTTPENTPPSINMISVDKTSVAVDETFTLTVNITDDISGVAYANSAYMSPSQEHMKYAILAPVSGDIYESVYTVEQYDELGVWKVFYVTATDYAGNTTTYYYDDDFDLSPADIEFRDADDQPPIITTNIPMYSVLQKGAILEFDAVDHESGIKSITAILSNGITSFEIQSPYVLTDGIYKLTITAEDLAGNIACHEVDFVVYNPECVSVTGGGWIDSPSGAYLQDPTLEGKASFGFSVRYNKSSTLPVGNVIFEFPMSGLDFANTSVDWLIISNSTAQIKGSGTINNQGSFGFTLVAIDENRLIDGFDRFRLKIWDKDSNQLIYDNALDSVGNIDIFQDSTLIHGNIVIHKN